MKTAISLLLLSFFLFACAKTEAPASDPAPASAAPPAAPPAPEVAAPEGIVSRNYIDATAALAANDFEKARTSLTALSAESAGEFQTRVKTAADAKDMSAMREAFKDVSELASRMELPPDHVVGFCPMFKGGASWVQKKGDVENPYFGKGSAMANCGTLKTE